MKIKIIKPFITSGYFANDEIEIAVDNTLLERIQQHNQIEILEEAIEENKVKEEKITPQRGRKKGSTKK